MEKLNNSLKDFCNKENPGVGIVNGEMQELEEKRDEAARKGITGGEYVLELANGYEIQCPREGVGLNIQEEPRNFGDLVSKRT